MSTYVYVEDDGQMVVGCCDGAHEAMYPLDDPEAVGKLLAALAEAGVLEVRTKVEESWKSDDRRGIRMLTVDRTLVRYVSKWKEAK